MSSPIQVYIQDDYMTDGIRIWITMKPEGTDRKVLHISGETLAYPVWDTAEPMAMVEPTVILPMDTGPLLLDALLKHYQGASDMHTVRSDLLHERARVDKFIDCMVRGIDKQGGL